MKIIVAGCGEVGTHLAKMLSHDNHDIVVIDTNSEKLDYIDSHFDIMTLKGSGASIEILKEAGISKCDLFVAVTPTEELNITSVILGHRLGAKKTIARIDNREYLMPINNKYFTDLGINSLIYPEQLAANEVVGLLNQTGTTEIVDFTGGKLSLYVIKLDENAPAINKSMIEASAQDKNFNFRAVAIHRNGKTIIPRGSDIFMVGDLVHVITNRSGVKTLMHESGKQKYSIKNLMILGGSRIGRRVARKLQNQYNIKLIEMDKQKCLDLSDSLNNVLLINGDGRNLDLLVEEGIKDMDAFIAVTENSETNILSCLAARQFGIKKTIAEIENIDYIDLAENIGIDTIINKKLITASRIFAYTLKADVQFVKCLTGTDADVLEFVAKKGSKITRDILKNIDFPEEAIVGGVVRGKTSFIAKGDTMIHEKDIVIVFALPSVVSKVEKFFS